jgi:hypothetical protein
MKFNFRIFRFHYLKMSEDVEQNKLTSDITTIINSFIQLLMLLAVMTIAILRFINTRSQLRINNLKDVYFKPKIKRLIKPNSV